MKIEGISFDGFVKSHVLLSFPIKGIEFLMITINVTQSRWCLVVKVRGNQNNREEMIK